MIVFVAGLSSPPFIPQWFTIVKPKRLLEAHVRWHIKTYVEDKAVKTKINALITPS